MHLGCSVDQNFKTLIESFRNHQKRELSRTKVREAGLRESEILDLRKSMKSGRMKIWACKVLFHSLRILYPLYFTEGNSKDWVLEEAGES